MLGRISIPSRPYERLGESRAQMAARIGVSERHLRRLLAKERGDQPERDMPCVEIVDSGSRPGYHYRLDHDQYSHLPSGPFRIGTGNGRVRVVRGDEDKTRNEKAEREKKTPKFQPKRPRGKKAS